MQQRLKGRQKPVRVVTNRPWDYAVETESCRKTRAGDGIRTHDNDVGNVVLYQLSYTRNARGQTASPSYDNTYPGL